MHMRKLPLAILGCVALFIALVVGLLVAKARAPRPVATETAPTKADYRIKEVHLQEQNRDGARWHLDAEYGEIFEDQGKTVMRKVTIRIEEPTRAWTVSGDEGDLAQGTKDVELRGNVVLVSSDGLRLETSRLNWAAADRRAWTDEAVTIYKGGAVVRGQGFESRVAQEATSIKGRLRATFGKGKPGAGEKGL